MRAARILFNSIKKPAAPPPPKTQIPVEMFPLFAAVAVAVGSGCYFTYRHFTHDKELRLWKNADLSNLDKLLNEEVSKGNEESK